MPVLTVLTAVSAVLIWYANRTPNYERVVMSRGSLQPIENRVLLLTVDRGQVNLLGASLSKQASTIDYYANGVGQGAAWFLLMGDATLTPPPSLGEVVDHGEYSAGSLAPVGSYQLVRAVMPERARFGDARVQGDQTVGRSVGASRWEFAVPTLDVSCDAIDRDLIISIGERVRDFPTYKVLTSCHERTAATIYATVSVDGDERLDTETGAPPATAVGRFVVNDADELPGFEFGVTSPSKAARASLLATLGGLGLGLVLSLIAESIVNIKRSDKPTASTAGSVAKVSWIGIAFVILLLLLGHGSN